MKYSLLLLAAAAALSAQDKFNVPFSNPSGTKKLVIDAMTGSITVRAHSGNDVIIETTGGSPTTRATRERKEPPPGMHRIGDAPEPEVSESNNTVRIRTGIFSRGGDYTILVPAQTNVTVKTLSGKELRIENINGEIEANNMSGNVTIVNASGSVVAHSMNGKVTVSLTSVMPDKAMSFSTFNGDLDITLPASIKANVKLKSDNGNMFTDFDIQVGGSSGGSSRRNGGTVNGTINGGGPAMQFTTYNGDITIHKK